VPPESPLQGVSAALDHLGHGWVVIHAPGIFGDLHLEALLHLAILHALHVSQHRRIDVSLRVRDSGFLILPGTPILQELGELAGRFEEPIGTPAALLQQFALLLCRKAIETRARIAQQGERVPQLPFRGNITDGWGGSFPTASPSWFLEQLVEVVGDACAVRGIHERQAPPQHFLIQPPALQQRQHRENGFCGPFRPGHDPDAAVAPAVRPLGKPHPNGLPVL
jgi:hypothetical protein